MNKHLSISLNNKSIIINNNCHITTDDFKILAYFVIRCVNSNVKLSKKDCSRRSIIFSSIKIQEINADSEWYVRINNCNISYMEIISIITKLGHNYSNCKYIRKDILKNYPCNY